MSFNGAAASLTPSLSPYFFFLFFHSFFAVVVVVIAGITFLLCRILSVFLIRSVCLLKLCLSEEDKDK